MTLSLLLKTRPVRFVIAGLFSAGLEMAILIVMVERFSVPLLYANVVAFSVVNIVNYILSRYWVFNIRTLRKRVEFPMFMFFVTCGLVLNQAVLWYLSEKLLVDYRISKVVAIGVVVIWNFFTRNNIIFKRGSMPESDLGNPDA
ncbi:GtrA family protein [Chryseolinea sp. T2]|uniref:GtrA family protein n=1 Tax=Chryseolinea sp. T2 TaxID=3129255 RepID=UPI003077367F